MKAFLTTTKGKVISGLITLTVVAAVVIAIVIANSGYRTIAVEELNGTTTVINEGVAKDAFIGQHLKSGDDISVNTSSDMTLALDTDKYIYAKEQTHFWIEATGKKKDSRTKIHLDAGSTLCRVDKKLASSEYFDVDTPNATMSVRGTVFRVSTYQDSEYFYTEIDVLEGEVYVQVQMETGENTDENRLLKAGEHAIVRSNKDISEFIKSDDDFGYDPDNDNGTALRRIDNVITTIDYNSFTQKEAKFLGRSIDEGRSLSITKDLLYDTVKIIDHDFSGKADEVDATCDFEGYYYELCVICGIRGEKHIVEKTAHDYEVKSDDSGMMVCKHCGEEISADEASKLIEEAEARAEEETKEDKKEESKAKESSDKNKDKCTDGHDYKVTEKVEATCVQKGTIKYKCSRCGDSYDKEIKALEHSYVTTTVEATCTSEGSIINKCSKCADTSTTKIAALGHNYNTSSIEATCTSGGTTTKTCSRCGDSSTTTTAALGHNYTTSSTAATCTAGGTTTTTCSRCGDSSTTTTAALGHSYSLTSSSSSTCSVAGSETYTCSRCGDSYSVSTGTADHDFSVYRQVVNMETGWVDEYDECSVCGARQKH